MNADGICAGPDGAQVSVFDSAGISDLTDVTDVMCEDAGCQQLVLVQDDPASE